MFVLGYSGHRRHGWAKDPARKLRSRIQHASLHRSIFEAVTSFGEEPEDIPLNFFPLDGVGHDSAASVYRDGQLVAAAAEERFCRFKHATAAGGRTLGARQATEFCLEHIGVALRDVEHIAFYCDFTADALRQRIAAVEPHLSYEIRDRVIDAYRVVHAGTVSNEHIAEELNELFDGATKNATLHYVPHHLAHAASAFYSSGYQESGVLTIDGFGEKSSSVFAIGGPDGLQIHEETMLPGSIGVLYMMMTAFLGFRPLDGEYKVMGLSSYGNAQTFRKEFADLFELQSDGTCLTTKLLRADFPEYIGNLFGPPRKSSGLVLQREMDIAAALQIAFEEAMVARLSYLKERYGIKRICLAGGAALNVVMTGKLARSRLFEDIYVFPAAGDDGASVGAAQYVYHHVLREPLPSQPVRTMSLGPAFGQDEITQALDLHKDKLLFRPIENVEDFVAEALVRGMVVGWFHGRMEFGPRALGNRSILADARAIEMRDVVNTRVKLREEFRPFAPAAMAEFAGDYFDMRGVGLCNFMEFVVPATELGAEKAKAVVHVDGSARIQTVERANNESFWKIIDAFRQRTGVPIVLNTSFNVRGEPMVCTPLDAIRCFLSTNIDILVLENYVVEKKAGKVLAEDMASPDVED